MNRIPKTIKLEFKKQCLNKVNVNDHKALQSHRYAAFFFFTPSFYLFFKINFYWSMVALQCMLLLRNTFKGFPGGAVVKNPPANAGDTGSSPKAVRHN